MCMCIYGIRSIKLLITLYFHIFVFLLIMYLWQQLCTYSQPDMTIAAIWCIDKVI